MPADRGAPGTAPSVAQPPWRAPLALALTQGAQVRETHYLQLATVDAEGQPRNRTVVFRGFGPDSEVLLLTDRRSAKWGEMRREPRGELAWYLPVTREQFRLTVQLTALGDGCSEPWAGIRQQLWDERGPQGQGDWLDAVPQAALPAPVADFILLVCQVVAADHLDLRPARQRQQRYRRCGQDWRSESLSP